MSPEMPEMPRRPDCLFRTSSTCSAVRRWRCWTCRTMLGSIEPLRVAMTRPSSGVECLEARRVVQRGEVGERSELRADFGRDAHALGEVAAVDPAVADAQELCPLHAELGQIVDRVFCGGAGATPRPFLRRAVG